MDDQGENAIDQIYYMAEKRKQNEILNLNLNKRGHLEHYPDQPSSLLFGPEIYI